METTAFSLVCDQAKVLSTPAGLMMRHPTGASYSVILSLPSEALNLRPGLSTIPAECSLARNFCDPGLRMEWMTLLRAVAGLEAGTFWNDVQDISGCPIDASGNAALPSLVRIFHCIASAVLLPLEIPLMPDPKPA